MLVRHPFRIRDWQVNKRRFKLEFYLDEKKCVPFFGIYTRPQNFDFKIYDGDTKNIVDYDVTNNCIVTLKTQIRCNFITIKIDDNIIFTLKTTPTQLQNFLNVYSPRIGIQNNNDDLKNVMIIGDCYAHVVCNVVPYKDKKTTLITTRYFKELVNLTDEEILCHQAIIVDLSGSLFVNESNINSQQDFDKIKEVLQVSLYHHLKYYYQTKILTYVFNLIEPCDIIPQGLLKYSKYNWENLIRELNCLLYDLVKDLPNVYIVDYNKITSLIGKRYVLTRAHSVKNGILSYHHIKPESPYPTQVDFNCKHVCNTTYNEQYTRQEMSSAVYCVLNHIYKIACQKDQIKLVIFDLDNTVWNGVATELINDPQTDWVKHNKFVDVWKGVVKSLQQRGIFLSICSKNDHSFIYENWRKLTGGLSFEIFLNPKINYLPKSQNILEIIKSLNLTPNSVLFIDDSELQRQEVKQNIPDVHIIGEGDQINHSEYIPYILYNAPELQRVYIANSSYNTLITASNVNNVTFNKTTFLDSLNLKIKCFKLHKDDKNIERVVELTNKTNQFNTTSIKRTLATVSSFLKNSNNNIYYFSVTGTIDDNDVDYGIVCVVYTADNIIEQFLMSCRVMGLDIEFNILKYVLQQLYIQHKHVLAYFKKTKLNTPCKDLYVDMNFDVVEHCSNTINQIIENNNHLGRVVKSCKIENDEPLATFERNIDKLLDVKYSIIIE